METEPLKEIGCLARKMRENRDGAATPGHDDPQVSFLRPQRPRSSKHPMRIDVDLGRLCNGEARAVRRAVEIQRPSKIICATRRSLFRRSEPDRFASETVQHQPQSDRRPEQYNLDDSSLLLRGFYGPRHVLRGERPISDGFRGGYGK